MRIAVILGTRPEIIKLSPIIRYCLDKQIDFFSIHTGQHYSYDMDALFFEELELPGTEYALDVGSDSHARQTGSIMAGVESVLQKEEPDVILVQGDTNTVLGGALAAAKLLVAIGHVEAGLRSFDRTMPEEVNRVLADHISEYLFVPTETARANLLAEGIPEEKCYMTGNTVVDAVYQNLAIARKRTGVLSALGVEPQEYFLLTAHRQENVDSRERLSGILAALRTLTGRYRIPVIFPVHPRTRKRIEEFGLAVPDGVRMIDPQGYLEFLQLEEHARLILTDSGGLQEEACILGVPCVTLRENTERPETLSVGSNVLAGVDPGRIAAAVETMLSGKHTWTKPFGDGTAGKKIVDIVTN